MAIYTVRSGFGATLMPPRSDPDVRPMLATATRFWQFQISRPLGSRRRSATALAALAANVMTIHPHPACPRCARTGVELASGRPLYRASNQERSQPVAIVRVFKCQCGLAATHD